MTWRIGDRIAYIDKDVWELVQIVEGIGKFHCIYGGAFESIASVYFWRLDEILIGGYFKHLGNFSKDTSFNELYDILNAE